MGDEDGELNGPEPLRILKTRNAAVHPDVVGQIAGQKQRRTAHGRDHAVAMGNYFPAFDEIKPEGEENTGKAVKKRVSGRQVVHGHGSRSSCFTADNRFCFSSGQLTSSPPV